MAVWTWEEQDEPSILTRREPVGLRIFQKIEVQKQKDVDVYGINYILC